MRRWTLIAQALAAIAIPVAVALATTTDAFDRIFRALVRIPLTRTLSWLALVTLGAAEIRFVTTLAQLLLAGGSAARLIARRRDPLRRLRIRRIRFAVSAAALATVVAFILAEATFRVFHIQPDPVPQSQYDDDTRVDNTVNALGIREDWDTIAPDDPRLRIGILGDSIVYGYTVEREETFCHLLEGMLAPDVPGGVLTINLGLIASAPFQQVRLYRRLAGILRPDVVIHVLYPNDLGFPLHDSLVRIYRTRDERLWESTSSYVLRFAEEQVRYGLAWRSTVNYFRGGRTPIEREHAWEAFENSVRSCKDAVESGGAFYAIVFFPWLARLDDYLLYDVHARMREFTAELDVPYLDLLSVFEGRDALSLRVSVANEHPNPLAHRLAAQAIAQFVRKDVLPKLHPATPDQ